MPKRNLAGGKAFKKGRKVPTDGGGDDKRFDGLEEGQDLGRVTKMLGNRRVLCFCGSDGMERVCKIRGVLCKGPKKQRIEIGDIVLISSRDYSGGAAEDDSDDDDGPMASKGTGAKAAETSRGAGSYISSHGVKGADGGAVNSNGKRDVYDLITKLTPSQARDARRTEKGLHKLLFETAGEHRVGVHAAFEFGYDSDEGKEDSEEDTGRTDKRDKIRHRGGARGGAGAGDDDGCDAMPSAPSGAVDSDSSSDDGRNIDIDAI